MNLESPVNPTCVFLDGGRNLEDSGETTTTTDKPLQAQNFQVGRLRDGSGDPETSHSYAAVGLGSHDAPLLPLLSLLSMYM